jgi:hypothetical protein
MAPTGQVRLLLLSSDLRRRYAEDILTALALPADSLIQFRYGSDYVVPALQRLVANGSIVGAMATLAFVADADTDEPFVVPARFASVVSATCIADIFTFKLRVGPYINLDQYPRKRDGIVKSSRTFLDNLIATNGSFYPAVSNFPDLGINEALDSATQWLGAARRLSLHKTFSRAYFVRIEVPVTQGGKSLNFNDDGRLAVVDQESVRIPVSFYSEKYEPAAEPVLFCSTDGTFIRISSDDTYEVALRYDSVEFWLHPGVLTFDTLSRVTIALTSQSGYTGFVSTHARFPVIVRRSRSRLATRLLTSAGGALLIALPAILGTGAPLGLRIACAVIGAALLAAATVLLNSAK